MIINDIEIDVKSVLKIADGFQHMTVELDLIIPRGKYEEYSKIERMLIFERQLVIRNAKSESDAGDGMLGPLFNVEGLFKIDDKEFKKFEECQIMAKECRVRLVADAYTVYASMR